VTPSRVNFCSLSVVIISSYFLTHKALCSRYTSLRGCIADLEFARIESLTLLKPQRTVTINVGAQNICDDRGPYVHSRTEQTTRTHITFQSTVTVKRGRV
jgi:hypothetical protein